MCSNLRRAGSLAGAAKMVKINRTCTRPKPVWVFSAHPKEIHCLNFVYPSRNNDIPNIHSQARERPCLVCQNWHIRQGKGKCIWIGPTFHQSLRLCFRLGPKIILMYSKITEGNEASRISNVDCEASCVTYWLFSRPMRTVIAWQKPSALGGARDGGGGGGGGGGRLLPIQKKTRFVVHFFTWKISSGDGLDRRTGERPFAFHPPIGRRTHGAVFVSIWRRLRGGFVVGDPVRGPPVSRDPCPVPHFGDRTIWSLGIRVLFACVHFLGTGGDI